MKPTQPQPQPQSQSSIDRQRELDDLLTRDADKVQALKKSDDTVEVDPEWLAVAEMGRYYGYEAVRDILDNGMSSGRMAILLAAGRKVEYRKQYEQAQLMFIAFGAAQTDKPSQTFDQLTRELQNNMKVEE